LARRNKTLIELSVQNLIDCSTLSKGCFGGTPAGALTGVVLAGGIQWEKSYPYEGSSGVCRFHIERQALSINLAHVIHHRDERVLMQFVAKYGPVAVLIDASSPSFKNYKSGIYFNKDCARNREALRHAMLIVGYGNDPDQGDYWILVSALKLLRLTVIGSQLTNLFVLYLDRKTHGELNGVRKATCA